MQIYTIDLRCSEFSHPDKNLIKISNDDIDNVIKNCVTGMQYGRFFADSRIPRDKAESYYVEVTRHYLKQEGCCVVLYEQGKPIGFAVGVIDHNKTSQLGVRYAYLWLIAIEPGFRGKGHGKRLFNGLLWHMKEVADTVEIGTQIWNTAANRLYVSRGCMPVSSLLSYHLWIDQ